MTPDQIQALRQALGENTEDFAARFHRSKRTIEDWEQGRRNPDGLILSMLEAIAASQKKSSRKRKR